MSSSWCSFCRPPVSPPSVTTPQDVQGGDGPNILTVLPQDVIELVCRFLNLRDLAHLAQTCSEFNAIVNQPHIFESFARKRWTTFDLSKYGGSWKRLLMDNNARTRNRWDLVIQGEMGERHSSPLFILPGVVKWRLLFFSNRVTRACRGGLFLESTMDEDQVIPLDWRGCSSVEFGISVRERDRKGHKHGSTSHAVPLEHDLPRTRIMFSFVPVHSFPPDRDLFTDILNQRLHFPVVLHIKAKATPVRRGCSCLCHQRPAPAPNLCPVFPRCGATPVRFGRVRDIFDGDRFCEQELYALFVTLAEHHLQQVALALGKRDIDALLVALEHIQEESQEVEAEHLYRLALQMRTLCQREHLSEMAELIESASVHIRQVLHFLGEEYEGEVFQHLLASYRADRNLPHE